MSQLLQYYKSFQQVRNASQNVTPTFEDLSIDDNLSQLQRLVRYAKSSIALQRVVHVKMIYDVANIVGFDETNNYIIPLLEPLSSDSERAVKQHLMEQVSLLSHYCYHNGGQDGYYSVLNYMLPVTARLLEDEEAEVREAACRTLVDIAKLIHTDDLGQHVLTIILRLAHEDDKEEMRMTACELLNSLAECLGPDLCKQFVIPEVVSLAEDPVFRVRKATALNFANICKVGGEHELLERLMPAFVRLSKDDMYRVRRACAEKLSEISKYVSDEIRVGVLVEIYLSLTQDPSKLVKQSILQQSGMFIATLPPKAVNEFILSHFCSMASGPTGDLSVDSELKHNCAYSFPAVLYTIGGQRWGELRKVYRSLVQFRSANVKQTLAASLHEVAKLLKECKIVEEELVPVFEEMIQDVEVVQMEVIKHLADFLGILSQPCRVSYLPLLHDILHSTNPFNWRLRSYLALQLPELLCLPPQESVYQTLFPLVMTLLQDPVASVRRESYKGVAKMILLLADLVEKQLVEGNVTNLEELESQRELESVIQAVNTLIRGEAFQLRQLWAELAYALLRDLPKELFEKYFIDGVLLLTSDPVSNVRVAIAIFITGWEPDDLAPWMEDNGNRMSPWKWLLQRPDIRQCVKRLAVDDRDVYSFIVKLKPMFPDIEFGSVSCHGKKVAPGGAVPVVNAALTKQDNKTINFSLSKENLILDLLDQNDALSELKDSDVSDNDELETSMNSTGAVTYASDIDSVEDDKTNYYLDSGQDSGQDSEDVSPHNYDSQD